MDNEDYIGTDGLIYCGKCHTAKQCRVKIFGERTVFCTCKCEQEREDALKRQMEIEKEQQYVDQMFLYSLIDSNFKQSTFENFRETAENAPLLKIAENYVANFDEMYKQNKGLLLYGGVGTGKTFISSCIANALIKKRIPVIVTSIIRLTRGNIYDKEEQQEVLRKMNYARLLVLDDFGTERDTDYKMEQVFDVIDTRYISHRPMIITTNLTLQEMFDETDRRKRRIYDRIREICIPVRVTGKSWRNEESCHNAEIGNKLLTGIF